MAELDGEGIERLLADRGEYLSVLADEPQTKPELTASLDCSRSTVDRVVDSLSDAGLIVSRNGRWHATRVGSCAVQREDSYVEYLNDLADARSLVSALPSETPVTAAVLADSTVYGGDGVVPDTVIEPMLTSVRQARTVRVLIPNTLAVFGAEFCAAAVTGDHTVELVFEPSVFDRLTRSALIDLGGVTEGEDVTLCQQPLSVSFGLWIADETEIGVIVYADGGVRGLLTNDTDRAVEWGRSQYRAATDSASVKPSCE